MNNGDAVLATGRVLQVNVSPGGIPKRPVDRAWVGVLGLEGDSHREYSVHGGPKQAVCLFGIEQIERLQSEGHPVEPGSVGENLTTTGIEWSLMPIGARARIGDQLELEVASPTTPCKTQKQNFSDGRFSRISIDLHPSDSRMYARVVRQGEVKPGDLISVTSVPADSTALDLLALERLDKVSNKANAASWRAAVESGFDVDFVEDGDIVLASSPQIDGPAFNQAQGLAQYPNLLSLATGFFDRHGRPGWLWTEDPPWPGAEHELTTEVFAAEPAVIAPFEGPAGLTIRIIGRADAAAFVSVYGDMAATSGVGDDSPNPWPQVYERLAAWPHRWLFLAELNGQPVGAASLHTYGKTGWLRGGAVAPEARGHGIQRALISARAKKAMELGCDLIGSMAEPDGPSATNLMRSGMRGVGTRRQYKYVPSAAI